MDYIIRPVRLEDAEGINSMRIMDGIIDTILAVPSERVSAIESWIKNMGPDVHDFVAVADGKVIAIAGLVVESRPRVRHCGSLGIMVHTDYQNMGVGRSMIKKLLDLADNYLMLVRVELTAYTDNPRAIHLYESMGFEKEGVRRKAAVKLGEYADEVLMSRIHPKFR